MPVPAALALLPVADQKAHWWTAAVFCGGADKAEQPDRLINQ
jgi:hypothetical protein